MGYEFRHLRQVETRTLLWLIGTLIVTILLFQSVELPYSSFQLYIFSLGKTPQQGSNTSIHGTNSTFNSSALSYKTITSPFSDAFEGKDGGARNNSGSEGTQETFFGFDEDSNSDNRTSPEGLAEGNRNVTLDVVQSSYNGSITTDKAKSDEGSTTPVKAESYNESFDSSTLSNMTLTSPLSDAFEGKDGHLRNNSGSEGTQETYFNFDEDSNPDNGTLIVGLTDGGRNLTLDVVEISYNGSIPPDKAKSYNGSTTTAKAENTELRFSSGNDSLSSNLSLSHTHEADFAFTSGRSENFSSGPVFPPDKNENPANDSGTPPKAENPAGNSSGAPLKTKSFAPTPAVFTISDMYDLLMNNRLSLHSMIPQWSSEVDRDLVYAKLQIENATPTKNDQELYAPLYRNVTKFQRSYALMEQMLKVYIYKEGEKPIFHQPLLDGIYASEGWFMKLMEANKHFVTKDPRKAHLFYLPFSSRYLETTLYVPNSHSHKNLVAYLQKYLDTIVAKYPFWNRTGGADHFLVACHDWAPSETRRIMANCIRALCNADVKEGFGFGKDVSLPETNIPKARNPLRDLGGKPPSRRQTLAFFAGKMHGYVRPILLRYWGDKDPDMKIFGTLPHSKGNKIYAGYMKSSKYCICPRGYEVNSPRVVEAIFYECVPVIISDNFIPPFFEILNWESFAVFVLEKDIPNLKNILLSIPKRTYLRMQMRVKRVQQHFLWHPNPVKYDLFHMILHSIWYNRVFQFSPRS
ncbi:hypothetical protein Ancab_002129 [Ancistrocladus abbreviatus]